MLPIVSFLAAGPCAAYVAVAGSAPPDALTAADSLRAIVIATCVRASSDTLPARFTLDRCPGGTVPDSFTAYPRFDVVEQAREFRLGERYWLWLREVPPPIAAECRRAFPWRARAQYEAVGAELVTTREPDSIAVRGREAWNLGRQPRAAQAEVLAHWVRSGWGGWAREVVSRHPEVWSASLRDACLERLEGDGDARFSWWLPLLAMHPDTATRAVFGRLAEGDSLHWETALRLVARDSSVWVRHTVLRLGGRILAGMRDPSEAAREPGLRRWSPGEPWTVSALVGALSAGRSPAERGLLIRVGWRTSRCHWLRHEVLGALADDTSRAARELLWDTIRGGQATCCGQTEGVSGPLDAVRHLTDGELRGALRDTSEGIVGAVVAEALRRRDRAVADTVIAWLRGDRLGDRPGLPLYLACDFIRRLGEVRPPAAFELLRAWGEITEDHVRLAVMEGLSDLGDRRAAPFFRRLARVPCGQVEFLARRSLAYGLMELGDASDAELFVRWAHECPDARDVAIEGIGTLAGPARMVEVIRQVEPLPLRPEVARRYEWIEAAARARRGRRRLGGTE